MPSSEPLFRRATIADAQAVRDLTRSSYAKWVAVIGREPRPMTADYERALREHRIDLLIVEGRWAGLIETVQESDGLLIENVAVAPAFQGQGHGRRLMAYAEQLALDLGGVRMRLYTNQRFAENIALYLGLGYRIVREEAIGDGVVVHMDKRLDHP